MGRPSGSKNKVVTGLSFNKRVQVLQKIILDESGKSNCRDRLNAIALLTSILNDKVKNDTIDGSPTMSIKIIEGTDTRKNTNKIPINTQENIANTASNTSATTVITPIIQEILPNTTTSTTTTYIQNIDKKDVINFEFSVDSNISEDDLFKEVE